MQDKKSLVKYSAS